MKKLKHIHPLVSTIATNQVVMNKKEFNKLVDYVNILTDTVNGLIEHQEASEKAIVAISKTME